jgi:capsular exopolysaccharide synthesis family protein
VNGHLQRLSADGERVLRSLEAEPEPEPIAIGALVRSYLPVALVLMTMGALAGLASVILEPPMYRTSLMVEVHAISESFLRNSQDPIANYDSNGVNLQTQLRLLKAGPFIGRVRDRFLAGPPPPPPKPDLFAKLRRRLRPEYSGPAVALAQAVSTAASTFDVRPINGTRLLELTCESTNPSVASSFLNAVAVDFVDDGTRMLSESSVRTSEWLGKQFEETKSKLGAAEVKLRDFVRRSGNIFIGSDTTADDVKVKQLQSELARAQAERIAKQARYESALKNKPGEVADPTEDDTRGELRTKLADIRRERAVLMGTYTPNHPRIKQLDIQEQELRKTLEEQSTLTLARLRNEFEDAVRHERLLSGAYSMQGGQVVAQSAKAAEYVTLKREVEGLRSVYDTLLQRLNQNGPASALPVTPMRLVEPSSPPDMPYKPKPGTSIGFGILGGMALTVAFAFVREKMDRSLKRPGSLRTLLNVPELGVIPAADRLPAIAGQSLFSRLPSQRKPLSITESSTDLQEGAIAHAAWGQGIPVLAESFRTTLASLVRQACGSQKSKVIMITSAEEGDGKTTVTSNLGIAVAESGRSVVIVDADFRRPALGKMFNVDQNRGFSEILQEPEASETPMKARAVRTSINGLWILPAGCARANVAGLIYSSKLPAVVNRLRQEFDIVLIDVPPILYPTDARMIGQFVDGVALVIRAGKTEKSSVLTAYQCLLDDGIPLYGTILNSWDLRGASRSKYPYYYTQP